LRLLTDAREGGRVPEILLMAQGREPHPCSMCWNRPSPPPGAMFSNCPKTCLPR
jgi:hypothetical protein